MTENAESVYCRFSIFVNIQEMLGFPLRILAVLLGKWEMYCF